MLFLIPSSRMNKICGMNRVVSRLASRDCTNPAAFCNPVSASFPSFSDPITETYTLACCKSPEVSTRVTVMFLTRGSRTSNKIVEAATSRMTSETRSSRCDFMKNSEPKADNSEADS